jgi:nucleolar GTP-binding protein
MNKPTLLVINKIDIVRLSDLTPENRAFVETIISDKSVTVVESSCYTEEGVMNVRNAACDALLAHRVEQKLKGSRIESVANKIHVAMPQKRDDVERKAFIPEGVKDRVKYDKNDPNRRRVERDDEVEMENLGIYSSDVRSKCELVQSTDIADMIAENYLLAVDSWKHDIMPEFLNGKNVADFIDPDIAEKLEALEREEEALEAQGFYASDDEEIVSNVLIVA